MKNGVIKELEDSWVMQCRGWTISLDKKNKRITLKRKYIPDVPIYVSARNENLVKEYIELYSEFQVEFKVNLTISGEELIEGYRCLSGEELGHRSMHHVRIYFFESKKLIGSIGYPIASNDKTLLKILQGFAGILLNPDEMPQDKYRRALKELLKKKRFYIKEGMKC